MGDEAHALDEKKKGGAPRVLKTPDSPQPLPPHCRDVFIFNNTVHVDNQSVAKDITFNNLGDYLPKKTSPTSPTNVDLEVTNQSSVDGFNVRDANAKVKVADQASLTDFNAGTAAPLRGAKDGRSTERVALLLCGALFVLICLCGAFVQPLTSQKVFFLRLAAALGAGAFAALIPGAIEVKLSPAANVSIRATGAIAMIIVIWLVNPPALLGP